MIDPFDFSTPAPKSASPKPAAGQLIQLRAALADAQTHLGRIPRHNAKAIAIQQGIINQWEQRIASLTSEDWI